MPTLPYRQSERSFRRFESLIIKSLSSNGVVWHDPYPKSVDTVSMYLREAIKSYLANNWPSEIDRNLFIKKYEGGQLQVTIKQGYVGLGPRAVAVASPATLDTVTGIEHCIEVNPALASTPEVVHAFAILKHYGLLPTRVAGKFDEAALELLRRQEELDIAFVNEGGCVILI